jgi:hypothetical protein
MVRAVRLWPCKGSVTLPVWTCSTPRSLLKLADPDWLVVTQ